MIEKFRRKTLFILTSILWFTLIGILATINIYNSHSNLKETNKILSTQLKIIDNDNINELSDNKELDNNDEMSKIYSVSVDNIGNYNVLLTDDGSGYSKEEIIKIASLICDQNKSEGIVDYIRYIVVQNDNVYYISFMDYSFWLHQQEQMLFYSVIIGLIGINLLFITALYLTKWLIKPVIISFDKQKQFISDAGHELKTPLTVMKASVDMLEEQYGDSKYFTYLRDENNRMTELVHELLSLSNLDKNSNYKSYKKIDLNRLIEGTCLPFECLAFENSIEIIIDIKEEVSINGNENQIKQLIEVLVDNAIKHAYAKSKIIIELNKEKNKSVIKVKNQGDPIPESERSKIFDRFYRVDKARNRNEGRYGLGLAIASSIVEEHKGHIWVECKNNWTTFTVKI